MKPTGRNPVPLAVLLALACAGGQGAGRSEPGPCDALTRDYAAALAEAQVCTPSASAACGEIRVRSLDDPCHCMASVDPARTATLDALLTRWSEQGCSSHGACKLACRAPSRTCVALADTTFRCDGG